MTVSSTTDFSGPYAPDGVTATFPFYFTALSAGEVAVLRVSVDDEPQVLTSYSVTINPNGGGSVHFSSAPAVGDPIYIVSDPSFEQQTTFHSQGSFSPTALNTALDRIAVRDIILAAAISRAPLAPPGDSVGVLPAREIRAGRYMAFDGNGKATVADGTGSEGSLRTEIVGRTGAGLVGSAESATGAVSLSVQARLRLLPVHPKSFGAVGDGIADDTAEVLACLTYAFASGRRVDGGTSVYAVSGNMTFDSLTAPWIQALKLKQLTPVNGRVTLGFTNCQKVRVDSLEVNVGSSATVGDINSTFGFYLDGGADHHISNVTAFGDGKGSLIAIWNANDSIFENLTARDATFNDAAATDDVLQGIWLNACNYCQLISPAAYDLTGNALYPNMSAANTVFANLRTRGIVLNGCTHIDISSPRVRNVEQGIDITGSDGNRRITVIGGTSKDCGSTAVKFANSAVDCKCVGHIAERVGMYAFMASGPSEGSLPYKTMDCDFIGCTAIDTGYNNIQYANKAGFIIRLGDFDFDYPKGIRFIGCKSIDRQGSPTTKYGFYNEVAYDAVARRPNEVLASSSIGHTVAFQAGIHALVCRVVGTGNQSFTTAVAAALTWDSETAPAEDTMTMHSNAINPERIEAPIAGRYRIRAKVTWAANGTGYRRMQLLKNGVTALATNAFAAVTGEVTTCVLSQAVDLGAGDYVILNSLQNSGGALNVDKTSSYFELRLEQPL